jgi:hypothetical protein
MSTANQNIMESLANELFELKKNIVLVYAFNGTGKTRLSVSYKDLTKAKNDGKHSGVYYNAYSEDLFVWDNDNENDGANIRLLIQKSSLNQYHALLDEDILREKLAPYKPKFDFQFNFHKDVAQGIESIQFFVNNETPKAAETAVQIEEAAVSVPGDEVEASEKTKLATGPQKPTDEALQTESANKVIGETAKIIEKKGDTQQQKEVENVTSSKELIAQENEDSADIEESSETAIKISRGEEQIFIWCFFLALFDIEGWTGEGKQSTHFFIDDPVSSLDDHNIFVTVASLMDLVDRHFQKRKIIVTTHHIGFFSILYDWLAKGEKADSYKKILQCQILKRGADSIQFLNPKNDVFLYHLELMQTLKKAIDEDSLFAYHFAILRQVLENISSFLGVGRISYVLEQIGFQDPDEVARIVNTMSHKTVFRYEAKELVSDNEVMFKDIFERIQKKYNFILHT